MKMLNRVRLFVTPWTVAYQAPPSMGFSRQGYWSGLPFPSPGDLPDPGIELGSLALQADASTSEPPGKPLFQVKLLNDEYEYTLRATKQSLSPQRDCIPGGADMQRKKFFNHLQSYNSCLTPQN